jgi:hypothetical protein
MAEWLLLHGARAFSPLPTKSRRLAIRLEGNWIFRGLGREEGQREFIVNNVHPRTLAPITYRYQDPRQFILTNTFSF